MPRWPGSDVWAKAQLAFGARTPRPHAAPRVRGRPRLWQFPRLQHRLHPFPRRRRAVGHNRRQRLLLFYAGRMLAVRSFDVICRCCRQGSAVCLSQTCTLLKILTVRGTVRSRRREGEGRSQRLNSLESGCPAQGSAGAGRCSREGRPVSTRATMRVGSAQDEDFEDFESRVDDVGDLSRPPLAPMHA